MTVKDLRTLVDNLDEYIHVPGGIERLKKTILHLAVSGQLVPQNPAEGTGQELYDQIQVEKQKLIGEGKLKKQPLFPEIAENERSFEIPKSWKWARLGDVVDFKYGKGIDRIHRDKSFEYPFFGANGELDRVDKYLVESDGIIIGRKGSAGAVNLTSGPFWPSDVTYYIEDEQYGAFNRTYLFYLLKSLNLESLANGIKPGLNRNDAYGLCVIIFPRKTQQRIAQKINELYIIIDDLDKKYKTEQEERRKLVVSSLAKLARGESTLALSTLADIIKTKEDVAELRKTILHLAVSGQLVPQHPSEGTGQELYDQIQAEKTKLVREGKLKKQKTLPEVTEGDIPFEIPKSWMWVRQSDLFEITSSKRVMQSDWQTEGIPFLRARDLTNAVKTNQVTSEIYVSKDYFESVKSTHGVPQPGDIMVSGVGTIGTPYVVKASDEFYFKDATILWFKNTFNLDPVFFRQVFLSDFMKKVVKGQSQGTTVDTYTIANAQNNIVPLPSQAEQTRIVQKTTQLLDLVTKLEKHLEK